MSESRRGSSPSRKPLSQEEQCKKLESQGFVATPEERPGVFRVYEKLVGGERVYKEVK